MIKNCLLIFVLTFLISCGNKTDDIEFANKVSGRYLFNPDEIIEVFHEDGMIYFKWRGAKKIRPLKISKDVFFIKEMNEKIQFRVNPSNNSQYLSLIPKEKDLIIGYDFKKLLNNEILPSEYLKNNDFEKALKGYNKIKEQDSLSLFIKESYFNSMGYRLLRDNNMEYALNVFKLNVALHPLSSNVYDSLGDALMRNGDTIQSVINYKKALAIDSGNRRAKKIVEKYNK